MAESEDSDEVTDLDAALAEELVEDDLLDPDPALEAGDDPIGRGLSLQLGELRDALGSGLRAPELALIERMLARAAALPAGAGRRLRDRALTRLDALEAVHSAESEAARSKLQESGASARAADRSLLRLGPIGTRRLALRRQRRRAGVDPRAVEYRRSAQMLAARLGHQRARAEQPEDAGRYNGTSLAVQALDEAERLSPDYLRALCARLDDWASLMELPETRKVPEGLIGREPRDRRTEARAQPDIRPSLDAIGDERGVTEAPRGERIELGPGSWLEWWPQFIERSRAARCLDRLREELPLREDVFEIHGRTLPVPRLLCWHGDTGCAYRYSRKTREPAPWTPTLSSLRAALRQRLGLDFNGVLANYYRDGRDSMGYHADDEPELGPSADDIAVASLSFGGTRRFLLKRRSDGALRRFDLSDGSLLVMRGRVQQEWRHALPKTRRAVEPRLNLTFRVLRR